MALSLHSFFHFSLRSWDLQELERKRSDRDRRKEWPLSLDRVNENLSIGW